MYWFIGLGLLALVCGVIIGRMFFSKTMLVASILNGNFLSGMAGWTPMPDDTPKEDAELPEEQWSDPTVHGASVEAPIGHSTSPVLVIGHLNGIDGPGWAGARQTFECGRSSTNWCTVTFEAKLSAAPGERAMVFITNTKLGRVARAEIPAGLPPVQLGANPPPDDFWTYTLSLQGCEIVSLIFRIEPRTAQSDSPGTQSTLMIRNVKSKCTPTDGTNQEGVWHRQLENVNRR